MHQPRRAAAWIALTGALALFFLAACSGSNSDPGSSADRGNDADNDAGNNVRNNGRGNGPGNPADRPLPDPRILVDREYHIWPQVWSQYAPGVESYEFKVNCTDGGGINDCFLSDLDTVDVLAPDGRVFPLDRDFNVNAYSGEITRRWVFYGPPEGGLPPPGDYIFRYHRDGATALEQTVVYAPSTVAYPTGVRWQRRDDDLYVQWTPPAGVDDSMNYKAILWNEPGTPETLVSQQFDWDASEATLPNVPLVKGGSYSLNVAVYYDDGYAYSEYVILTWE